MALFDDVINEYYECGVGNLYMSAKFCRYAYTHRKKINLHGVTRKSGRGLPSTIIQQELQNKAKQEKVGGNVIASELVVDSKCPSLMSVSVYDTQPVNLFSMKYDSIKWEDKSIPVYNRYIGQLSKMKFLRLNVNN